MIISTSTLMLTVFLHETRAESFLSFELKLTLYRQYSREWWDETKPHLQPSYTLYMQKDYFNWPNKYLFCWTVCSIILAIMITIIVMSILTLRLHIKYVFRNTIQIYLTQHFTSATIPWIFYVFITNLAVDWMNMIINLL